MTVVFLRIVVIVEETDPDDENKPLRTRTVDFDTRYISGESGLFWYSLVKRLSTIHMGMGLIR